MLTGTNRGKPATPKYAGVRPGFRRVLFIQVCVYVCVWEGGGGENTAPARDNKALYSLSCSCNAEEELEEFRNVRRACQPYGSSFVGVVVLLTVVAQAIISLVSCFQSSTA